VSKNRQTDKQTPGNAEVATSTYLFQHLFLSFFFLFFIHTYDIFHSFICLKVLMGAYFVGGGIFFYLFDCAVCRENAVINFEQLDVMSEFTDGVSSVCASRHAGFQFFLLFHFSPSAFF